MTLESLKAIIAEVGGDAHVIGFLFGSAYKFIYNKTRFNSSIHIKDSMNCVMIDVEDFANNLVCVKMKHKDSYCTIGSNFYGELLKR